MSKPNMENKLALLWRENVLKLMDHFNMKATDLGRFTNRSESTLQSCFGGKTMKAQASRETIAQLERGMNLNAGSLSSPHFNPATATSDLVKPETAQLASINIPIPSDKLERIMRILLE